jgi:hypothetical protein
MTAQPRTTEEPIRRRTTRRRGSFIATGLALLLAVAGIVATAALRAGAGAGAALAPDPISMGVETSYVLRTSLSYQYGTLHTLETITIRNTTTSGISSINLSVLARAFGELTSLSGLTLDGKAVNGTWTNSSNLLVYFGKTVQPGQTATLSLRFALKASGAISTSLEGRLSKANGIMQVSHWFPVVSSGHGLRYPGDSQYTRTARRIRLEVTTDTYAVKIAAPGRRVSLSGRTHVYEMDYTRDFAFAASPYYKLVSTSAAGVTIGAYYTSGNGAAAIATAAAAITRFESLFGQYQWPRFIIAQTGRASSGNEYPGIIFVGGPLMANREVVAHEVAHQWWYAMAGNDQLREPWLDEGLAEFSAAYFYGTLHSYNSTRPVNSTVYDFPAIPANLTSSDPNSYDQTVYFKAGRFLNALRVQMGSSAFWGAMRDLFLANRNGVMTTREFYDTFARYGASTTFMRSFIAM